MTTQLNYSAVKIPDDDERVEFRDTVGTRHAFFGCILTIFFFQVLCRLVVALGTPKSVPLSDHWKWRNLLISWIHALMVGVWDISCFILFPDMFTDLITYGNWYMYSMITFSSGYFIYDFIDIYLNNQLFKQWEVILHHIAVAGMFIYNILACTCIAYNCIALLVEINSFFLHSRKLLQMLQVDFRHWFYRLTAVTNLVTFVIFRGLPLAGIMYGMMMWRSRVPLVFYLSLGASMFVMLVMNPILFYRLFKSDILKVKKNRSATKIAYTNGVNNNVKHE